MSDINDELIRLAETKALIKDAINAQGVEVTSETPFREYADKINQIESVLRLNPLITDGSLELFYLNTQNKTIYCGIRNDASSSDRTPGVTFDISTITLDNINPIHIKIKYASQRFVNRSSILSAHNSTNDNSYYIISYGNSNNVIALSTDVLIYSSITSGSPYGQINEVEVYIYPNNNNDIIINGSTFHNFSTTGFNYGDINTIELFGSGVTYNNGATLYYEDSFIEVNGIKYNIFV